MYNSNPNFVVTETVGGFDNIAAANSFDDIYESTYQDMLANNVDIMTDAGTLAHNPAIRQAYEDALLSALKTESEEAYRLEEVGTLQGKKVSLYDQVHQMMENCLNDFVTESTTSQLLPIKTLDLPILVKEHLKIVAKDIIQTEVTPTPIIKKHLEQTYIYSAQNPAKRYKYPQCFFDDGFKELYKEGKGIEIREDKPVALPCDDLNIITATTDLNAEAAKKQTLSMNTQIIAGYVEDEYGQEVKVMFEQPMRINLSDGQWLGGKINQKVTDSKGAPMEVIANILGDVNLTTQTTSLVDTKGVIKKVVFSGFLTNENNERHVRFDYERTEREFKIEDGSKADMPLSMETLEESKALLNIDMYKKTYNTMTNYLADQEDSDILAYLDKMFERYKGVELDPLGWNSLVIEDKFDAEAGYVTTALPADYIQSMLKFKIDGIINDIADTVKMENLTFVIYGNPRYIRFLDSSINWVTRPGSTSNGVKLDYAYGLMTTNGVKVQVVATKKINAQYNNETHLHRGLRIIPFPTNPEQMTFKHYKYTTHIVTNSNSAYRAPELPGGSQTYFMGVSRYANEAIQGIQCNLYLQNFENYITLGLKPADLFAQQKPSSP